MTYRALKYVTRGLLTGDISIPKEEDVFQALLGMAYNHIENKCTVLDLMTLDKSSDIKRMGPGKHLLKRANLPETEDDELEVGEDLGYVAASLIASYVSAEKVGIHQSRADTMIRDYNAKVIEVVESLKARDRGDS